MNKNLHVIHVHVNCIQINSIIRLNYTEDMEEFVKITQEIKSEFVTENYSYSEKQSKSNSMRLSKTVYIMLV